MKVALTGLAGGSRPRSYKARDGVRFSTGLFLGTAIKNIIIIILKHCLWQLTNGKTFD